jgi:hypothetical protein
MDMTFSAPIDTPGRLGRYELLERIASGRTTDVFLANSHGVEGFRRTVVIKRLKPTLAARPRFLARFLEQTRQLFTLSHANLVQVLDLDEADGTYYLTEEYVEGYDLATMRVMASVAGLTLTAPLGLYVAAEVAKGVDYGHRRLDPATLQPLELAHGDLHPCNLLIGFQGQVKVADFGLGPRATEHDLGTDEGLLRAFSYAAPEVARGEPPTQRSDLFSLGLLLIEVCRGHHPYRARTAEKVREKAERGAVPERYLTAVPEALRDLVAAALEHDPAERVLELGTLYDRIISYLHQEHEHADANALAELIHKIGDFDLGTAVVYSGMIGTTEHSARHRIVGGTTLETELVDDEAVWRPDAAPPPPARTSADLAVPLPAPETQPLGANGREPELEVILEQPERVGKDGVRLLFVSGPRGIGKSYVMREAFTQLTAAGYATCLLAPDGDASARPYGALLDFFALRTLGRPLLWVEEAADALESTLAGRGLGDPESRRLAAQLVELFTYDPHERLTVRGALGRLFRDVVRAEANGRPFVLLLDGPERADILSLELLHAVIASGQPGPLLLVVSSLNKALLNQLGRAAESERRASLVLPTLTPDGISALFRRVAGTAPTRIHEIAAAGTPQWAVEVALAQRFGQFEGQRPDRLEHFAAHLGDPVAHALAAVAIADIAVPEDDVRALLVAPAEPTRVALRRAAALHLLACDPYGGWSVAPRSLRSDFVRIFDGPRQHRLRTDLASRVAFRHRGNSALNRPLRARLKIDVAARSSAVDIGRDHAHLLVRQGFTDVALSVLDGLATVAASQSVGAPGEALELRLEQVQLALSGMRLERGRQILAQLPSRADDLHDEEALLRALAQRARLALRRGELADAQLELRRLVSSVDTVSARATRALVHLALGEFEELSGHLGTALTHVRKAWELVVARDRRELLFDEIRFRLAGLLVRRRENAALPALVEQHDTLYGPGDNLAPAWARGLTAHLAARPEAARAELESAYQTARRTGRAADALEIAHDLIAAMVDVGAWEPAREQLSEAQDLATHLNARRARLRLDWVERYLAARRGGPEASRAQTELNAARAAAEADGNLTDALELAWLWGRATRSGSDVVLRLAQALGDRAREHTARR